VIYLNKVIFWDFHNTLADWPNLFTSGIIKVLDEFEKGHMATEESIRPWIENAFPWDRPEKSYLHLRDAEEWWNNAYKAVEKAYIMNGISPEKAHMYSLETRKQVIDPQNYNLFDDTLDTLKFLKENGFRNIILSNHIPELPGIARSLGLMEYIDICITSANVGFEKPNPGIYRYAMEITENPVGAWMVGDSLRADVRGAEAAGLKAILVRKPAIEPVKYFSPDLKGTVKIIQGE
jgi:putative hydrolase of the HAD superfamily